MGHTVPCPGSLQVQAPLPDEETEDAKEGNAVHWVSDSCLKGIRSDWKGAYPHTYIGAEAPNGIIITGEMAEGANLYVGYAMKLIQKVGGLNSFVSESRLAMSGVHPDLWGDADLDLLDGREKTAYILDLKYGFKAINIFEHWQTICYHIGQAHKYGPEVLKFVTAIVQPRAFHPLGPIRTISYNLEELSAYAVKIKAAIVEALSSGPRLITGEHCYQCKGLYLCPAKRESAAASVDIIRGISIQNPTSEQLGQELTVLNNAEREVKQRKGALMSQAEARIHNGEFIPGWEMGIGRSGNRVWTLPPEQVQALGKSEGVNLLEDKPCSPAVAEKRGLSRTMTASFTKSSAGKQKLMPVDENLYTEAFKK